MFSEVLTPPNRRIVVVWTILIVATLASSLLGIEQGAGLGRAVAAVLIGVALFKVYLIGIYFMDLQSAPRLLRTAFEGYVIAVFVALSFIDLVF